MTDLRALIQHNSGLRCPVSNDGDGRTWHIDSQPAWRQDAGARSNELLAVLKPLVGGTHREYLPEQVQVVDGYPINAWLVLGHHNGAPPHDAFEERVAIGFEKDLPNGTYAIGDAIIDAPAIIDYSLMYRNPPYFPDGDIVTFFEVVSGKLILQNDPEQGSFAGTFMNVLIKIHKIDHSIGIGPDTPYELMIVSGNFRARA